MESNSRANGEARGGSDFHKHFTAKPMDQFIALREKDTM